jgi:hypothetical protein
MGVEKMIGGLVVFGVMAVLLCVCFYMAFLRTPQCPKCQIPLEAVEEWVRDLGTSGVETVIQYECSDCYRGTQRMYMFTHIG